MAKKILLFLSCIGCMQLMAQTNSASVKNDKDSIQTVITAKLDNIPNDTVVTVFEPYSGEWDSTYIKDHKFRFELPMKKGGSMYVIQIGSAKNTEYVVNNGLGMVAYLDSGVMHIKGKNLNDAKYSGSSWVKDWQEVSDLTSISKGDGKKFEELKKQYNKARLVGDEDAMDKYGKTLTALDIKLKSKYKNWIKANPDSRVCGYLITCYLGGNNKVMDSLYNTLGEHAKQSRIIGRWKHPGEIDPSPLSIKIDTSNVGNMPGRPEVGTVAPVIEALDVNGKKVSLSDFKGKYVLIDFWASWCAPCIAMVPSLKATNDKFKHKNFMILGVSLDSKKEGWIKAIKKEQLDWINISNLKGWGDPASKAYGISAIPANVLVGPDGKIVGMNLFNEALDKKLSEVLDK